MSVKSEFLNETMTKYTWINPRTGEKTENSLEKKGEEFTNFCAPSKGSGCDWLLYIFH